MKFYKCTLIVILFILSCKKDGKVPEIELSVSEKIAHANGIENWDKVSQIEFTFNVDVDSSHFERSWIWSPKSNNVSLITKKDTISFNRSKIDSTNLSADKSFINDKFWMLFPFQLVWDEGTSISNSIKSEGPISKKKFNKITISYSSQGGYSPGDAYDVFFDDDYIIREWIYRKANTSEPSLICSFENYQDFNGIKIALDHKKTDQIWNLNFSHIKVTMTD